MTLFKFIFFSLLSLAMLIMSIAQILGMKSTKDFEKPSPFECGFISKMNYWSPFSLHFFLSALIFLIFDVELILIFPYLMLLDCKLGWTALIFSFTFLVALSVGFFIEWSNKFLEWTN